MANATTDPEQKNPPAQNGSENDDFYNRRAGLNNTDKKDAQAAGQTSDQRLPANEGPQRPVYDRPGNEPDKKSEAKPGEPDRQNLSQAEQAARSGTGASGGSESAALPTPENQIASGFRKLTGFGERLRHMSNRRKVAVATLLATITTSIFLLIASFLPFELIQIKHVVTDQIAGTEAHVYQLGRSKLYSTQFFFDKNGQYSGSKVGGVRRLMLENRKTKSMVAALEKNGYRIEFERLNGTQTGRIKSLQKIDSNGKVIASYTNEADLTRAWDIRTSGDLPNILKQVIPDKSAFWYNRATKALYQRWGLTRTNWLKEQFAEKTGANAVNRKLISIEDRFRTALRQKLFGSSQAGVKIDAQQGNQTTDEQLKTTDPTAPETRAAQLDKNNSFLKGITDSATSLRAQLLSDPKATFSNSAQNLLRINGGDLNKALVNGVKPGNILHGLNILNVPQQACTANTALNTVEMGARVLRAQQLMVFSLSVLNIADAVQNGKSVTPDQINALMQYLNSKDSNGKNMFASSGWRYWADSQNKNNLFTGYDKNQRDTYSTGGGFTGVLQQIRLEINNIMPANSACHYVNSPLVTAFGFVAGAVAGFFTGGGSVIANTVVSIGQGVFVSYAINYAEGVLTPMIAGTIINGSEQGTAIGNAFISGAEVLTNANASSTGMRAYTKPEYKVALASVQADQKAQLARTDIASRLFSPNVSSSLTARAANGLASLSAKDVLRAPIASLGNLFHLNVFGGPALAAENVNSCPDKELNDANLATTPLCNPIMGIPDSAMNNPAYAPDKIDDTINAKEQNVDDFGTPIPGSSYDKYIKHCTADPGSISGAIDVLHSHKTDDYSFHPEICANDLFNIYRLYMTGAQGENDALTGNLGG